MNNNSRYENIRTGDFIVIEDGWSPRYIVTMVTKVTPKQIVTQNRTKYWKHNGKEVGRVRFRLVGKNPELIRKLRKGLAKRELIRCIEKTIRKLSLLELADLLDYIYENNKKQWRVTWT